MKRDLTANIKWARGCESENVIVNSLAAVSAKTSAGDTARRG